MLKTNSFFYIDKSVKSQQPDIYKKIMTVLESKSIGHIEEENQICTPAILVVNQSLNSTSNKEIDEKDCIFIKVDDGTLSLLNEDFASKKIILKSEDEVEGIVELALSYNDLKIKIIETPFYNQGIVNRDKFLKKNKLNTALNTVEKEISEASQVLDLEVILSKYKSEFNNLNFKILKFGEIQSLKIQVEHCYIGEWKGEHAYLVWEGETRSPYFPNLISYVCDKFLLFEKEFESLMQRKKWESFFTRIDLPIIIFNRGGEVIIQNSLFSDLNLTFEQCQKFENNEHIQCNNSTYRVLFKQNNISQLEYVFIPVDEMIQVNQKPSNQELGIICSSIAHEINNAIAGVLAALDFLKIDDVPDNIIIELDEMRSGVKRCKKIVDVFLGFSQKRFEDSNLTALNLEECITQSLDLLRYRLAELQMNISCEFLNKKEFNISTNPYILSMILYLIFNNLITDLSHQRLIKQDNLSKLQLLIEEHKGSCSIKLRGEAQVQNSIIDSKLLLHLVESIGLKLSIESGGLKLTKGA